MHITLKCTLMQGLMNSTTRTVHKWFHVAINGLEAFSCPKNSLENTKFIPPQYRHLILVFAFNTVFVRIQQGLIKSNARVVNSAGIEVKSRRYVFSVGITSLTVLTVLWDRNSVPLMELLLLMKVYLTLHRLWFIIG